MIALRTAAKNRTENKEVTRGGLGRLQRTVAHFELQHRLAEAGVITRIENVI
ncbi:MAG TPA: hypothetical protein VGB55_06800 [Tepidisphaeraceae bacterium]|jgi:hypothetical protein